MAVTLTGAEGLFTRLGKLEGFRKDIATHQADIVTEVDDVMDQYPANRDYADAIQSGQQGFIDSAAQPFGAIRATASKTIIEMVQADNPQPSKDITTALKELIAQMEASGADVEDNTVTIAAAAGGSNSGNGVMVVDIADVRNLTLQNARAEDLVIECVRDTLVSGTEARDEVFTVKGEPARASDDRLWPGGSGISSTLRLTSPDLNSQDSPGQNILANSNLFTYTVANTPDFWTIPVGVPGTTVFQEGTTVYRKSLCLEIQGNGAELTNISQAFGTAGQTTQKVKPGVRYACYYRIRRTAGLAAGVLRVALKDGGGSIVNDAAGAAISQSTTLTTVASGGFDAKSFVFGTVTNLPTGLRWVIELTTAITAGQSIFIADMVVVPLVQFSGPSHGPRMIVLPGASPWRLGDKFTVSVANNRASEFQSAFERWFNTGAMSRINGYALQIPYDTGGAETIADTLIS